MGVGKLWSQVRSYAFVKFTGRVVFLKAVCFFPEANRKCWSHSRFTIGTSHVRKAVGGSGQNSSRRVNGQSRPTQLAGGTLYFCNVVRSERCGWESPVLEISFAQRHVNTGTRPKVDALCTRSVFFSTGVGEIALQRNDKTNVWRTEDFLWYAHFAPRPR